MSYMLNKIAATNITLLRINICNEFGNSALLSRSKSSSSVADFYNGKSVFITGGTGFLGKLFIEKLLYSCEGLDKLYLLIRSDKGLTPAARVQQITDTPIFDRIKNTRPHNLNKIIPITGDISEEKLGLSPKDEETLKSNVSVVIHSAATVKFDHPLSVVMNLNFEGTRRVMNLCRQMKNLHSFVYISTAFSQPNIRVLEEVMYPPPMEYNDVYKSLKKHGDDINERVKILRYYPNTYTFSKSLTENYVGTNPEGIPAVIVRPSVVTATYKDPLPGWINNWMALGLLFDIARGHNRYMLTSDDVPFDMIPVDYVANLTVIAAAKGVRKKEVAYYNSSSSGTNPISWRQAAEFFNVESIATGNYERYPKITSTQSKAEIYLKTLATQKFPAHAADLILRFRGEEPRYVQNLNRVLRRRDVYSFFTSNAWIFKSEKAQALFNSLPIEDQEIFPCDPTQIKWDEYMKITYGGLMKYLVTKKSKPVKANDNVLLA